MIFYIGLVTLYSSPLDAHAEVSTCPPLLSPAEITSHQQHLEARCTLISTGRGDQRPITLNTSHVEWIIQVLALELSVNGGVGWRIYQPLTVAPTRLPHFAPPRHTCAYHTSLFERDGRVWALERWSVRPPSTSTSSRYSLSHPHYTTSRVLLSASAALSNTRRWELTPEGVCPSLLSPPLPQPLNTSLSEGHHKAQTTHTYSLTRSIQTTIQSKPLLGCGSGAPKRGRSFLNWTHLP